MTSKTPTHDVGPQTEHNFDDPSTKHPSDSSTGQLDDEVALTMTRYMEEQDRYLSMLISETFSAKEHESRLAQIFVVSRAI